MKTQHTPTPYRIEKNTQSAYVICSKTNKIALLNCIKEAETNAAFIVRACNNHEALVTGFRIILDSAKHSLMECEIRAAENALSNATKP